MAPVCWRVGHYSSWRAGAIVLAATCALLLVMMSGNSALADPDPSSSTSAPPTPAIPAESPTTTPESPPTTPETPTRVTPTTTETSTERRTTAHMNLVLNRDEGYPATHFTGTLTGVSACANAPARQENIRSSRTELFQWDGESLPPDGGTEGVRTDPATDSATIDFTVPTTAVPGAHEVAVACPSKRVTAQFTVLAPTIVIKPEQGYTGSSFDATVAGFDRCTPGDMSFQWDGARLEPTNRGADGTFAFTVPGDAPTTPHSVTASCGSTTAQPASFTVLAAPIPTLRLGPPQGTPGSSTVATVTGFDPCTPADMSFQWDGTAWPGPASPNPDGTFGLAVPQDASAEEHTVTASCGSTSAPPATFTVLAASKPTLTLQPGHGQVGREVTAYGAGFPCDGDVQLHWDDTVLAEHQPATFTSSFTVPQAASPLVIHSVTASCRLDSSIKVSSTFTVTSLPKLIPEQPEPTLTLQPTSGHSEDTILATGDRFRCATHSGPVNLAWDDGTTLIDASLDQSGHFTTSILAPRKVDGGRVTLRATCSDGVVLAADFTVLGSPLQPPPKHNYWWVLWVFFGIAAITALTHVLRQRRPVKPPPPPHVHAVGHTDGAPIVIARETPEPGERTHTLRMEAYADLGTQSVREVNDDYTDTN